MEKVLQFIIVFIIAGSLSLVVIYLINKGFTNPFYVDWNSSSNIIWSSIVAGLISVWIVHD